MISLNVPHKLYLILSTVKLLTVAFKLLGLTCFCLYKLVINKLYYTKIYMKKYLYIKYDTFMQSITYSLKVDTVVLSFKFVKLEIVFQLDIGTYLKVTNYNMWFRYSRQRYLHVTLLDMFTQILYRCYSTFVSLKILRIRLEHEK